MKILFVNSVLGVGSTGRIIETLYKYFKNEGHEVKIAYGRNKYDKVPGEDQYCFYNKLNVYTHTLMARIFDNASLSYSSCTTKKLIKFIEEFNPDVVNLHNLHGYYLNAPMLLNYLSKKNIKCVFTLHDCWLFTGHCSHFYFNDCSKYCVDCKGCKFKKTYPSSLVFSNSKKNLIKKKNLLDAIENKSFITPSIWLKNFAEKSLILKNERIDVVYNAIDYDVFNLNAKEYFEKDKLPADKYILCVANIWTKEKGIEKIIEMSNYLPEDYKIVMVGKLNDKSVLNDKILHIEHTNNVKELAYYYANAHIFFNPTLEDNFPTVNIESLACGAPILLFDKCSGGVEIVNEKAGFIVSKNMGMQEIVDIILDKKSKFDRKQLYEYVTKNFSKDLFCSRYKEIFDEK